jgi:hypothetical protein
MQRQWRRTGGARNIFRVIVLTERKRRYGAHGGGGHFLKQEAPMGEVKRMTQEAQEQASEMTEAVEAGFETANRSFTEANKGFQAIASELNDFSRRRLEDVLQSWEQVLRARSFGDVVEAPTHHVQRAYAAYTSEMSKLGEMYRCTARNAAKPVAHSTNRTT